MEVIYSPKNILIPDLFLAYNQEIEKTSWTNRSFYNLHTTDNGKASSCIRCGNCKMICPQKLKIRDLLLKVKEVFE